MTAPAPESTDGLKPGELVLLDYDLWAEVGGKPELIDTTHEEVFRESNPAGGEGRKWGPRPHQVDGEFFPTGIEKAIVGKKVGEELTLEFTPQDAFGERDPNLIELFSMHEIQRLPEMRREDAHLELGSVLTINGRRGRVVTLTAARVRVDFNPPFAGRKVRGKFRVVERIGDLADQTRAIVELQYGLSSEFHVEHRDKTLTLKVPERTKFDVGWMAAKARVIDRLRSHLHPETIRIVEEYVTPVEAKPTESPRAKTAPPSESGRASDAGGKAERGKGGAGAEKPAAKHAAGKKTGGDEATEK